MSRHPEIMGGMGREELQTTQECLDPLAVSLLANPKVRQAHAELMESPADFPLAFYDGWRKNRLKMGAGAILGIMGICLAVPFATALSGSGESAPTVAKRQVLSNSGHLNRLGLCEAELNAEANVQQLWARYGQSPGVLKAYDYRQAAHLARTNRVSCIAPGQPVTFVGSSSGTQQVSAQGLTEFDITTACQKADYALKDPRFAPNPLVAKEYQEVVNNFLQAANVTCR